jgi:hypothetical protein
VSAAAESDTRRYQRWALCLLAVNALSALLFIVLVPRPVYDDLRNIRDVQRYVADGINSASIRAHVNPTGPGSFIWMALSADLLGGKVLLGGRVAVLASGILLGFGMLALARLSSNPELLYASLIVTLVFPHTMTCLATLMTEGPALFFGVLGALAWVTAVSDEEITRRSVLLAMLGGLFMGIAVTCRQYYLALLPAAAIFACLRFLRVPAERRRTWLPVVVVSLLLAAIPVIALAIQWKGLSTPGMADGAFYKRWRTSVAPNFARPFIALFETAGYLALLTFPIMQRVRLPLVLGAPSAVCGLIIAHFRTDLLQPGPLRSLIRISERIPHGDFALLAVLAAFIVYNLLAFGLILWRERAALLAVPMVVFSLLVLIFFILEQSGVGGNLPFYDRYVLQVAPFLALIAFWVLPKIGRIRGLVLVALFVIGQALLWRNTFVH